MLLGKCIFLLFLIGGHHVWLDLLHDAQAQVVLAQWAQALQCPPTWAKAQFDMSQGKRQDHFEPLTYRAIRWWELDLLEQVQQAQQMRARDLLGRQIAAVLVAELACGRTITNRAVRH